MWDKLKKLFGGSQPPPTEEPPDTTPRWLPDEQNPWGVPVVDLRPFTLQMLAMSQDPRMAHNAVSYLGDDGLGFAAEKPKIAGTVDYELHVRIDRRLVDGALFLPSQMEDKWAIYLHRGRILVIRGWQRELFLAADVRVEGNLAVIGPLHGAFLGEDEPPQSVRRHFEYLLRSHALNEPFPAPLFAPPGDLRTTGTALFSLFGRKACFAAESLNPSSPARPLRSDTLLHIAVARGDRDEVQRQVEAGVPLDLPSRDGFTPLHWALDSRDPEMLTWCIAQGFPVDGRSIEGATALMNAVQRGILERCTQLLDHHADPDARDGRGFTALHRAAEMGHTEVVRLLLLRGANRDVAALGHTPLSLARARERTDIIALLEG